MTVHQWAITNDGRVDVNAAEVLRPEFYEGMPLLHTHGLDHCAACKAAGVTQEEYRAIQTSEMEALLRQGR